MPIKKSALKQIVAGPPNWPTRYDFIEPEDFKNWALTNPDTLKKIEKAITPILQARIDEVVVYLQRKTGRPGKTRKEVFEAVKETWDDSGGDLDENDQWDELLYNVVQKIKVK